MQLHFESGAEISDFMSKSDACKWAWQAKLLFAVILFHALTCGYKHLDQSAN